jgi:exopolysaccharide biosynthesis polyprenyl glycosylphosphotransferase
MPEGQPSSPPGGNGARHNGVPRRRERLELRQYRRIMPIADTVVALIVLLGAFLASNIDRMPTGLHEFLQLRLTLWNLVLVVCFMVAWRAIGVAVGLYDKKVTEDRRLEAARIVVAVSIASAVALIFPEISVTRAFSHLAILYYWTGTVAGMFALRLALRAMLRNRVRQVRDILIVGSGPRALTIYHDLVGDGSGGHRLLGFVDLAERDAPPEVRRHWLGDLGRLEEILMGHAVDEVIIALPVRSRYAEIQRTIEICERGGVTARYLSDVFKHRRSGEAAWDSEFQSVIPAGVSPDDRRLLLKRLLDVAVGGLALVASAPVLLLAAVAIKATSPGPVLFAQERYGHNKRRFRMYKLRTMVMDAEAQQALLEARNEATGPVFKIRDDPRLTPAGRILRRLSIDELPQLINVLRGDMSLVGPRPLPLRDVARFSEPALMRRFSVPPGITGLWQVSGRSELEFDRWIQLDLQYIDGWSLGLDVHILLRTVPTVLLGKGAV